LFDRATGCFSVVLSTLLVTSLLNWHVRPGAHLGALSLFVFVGVCLVFIAEGLHRALETANAAQRASTLLLDEMSHRVKNKFAMVSSIITLQARRSSPEVRQALDDIARRVSVIAAVHDYLQLSRHEGMIDMSEYVPTLCKALSEALLGPRPISITGRSEKVDLPPDRALAIGLIVNELVTNALKYAFDESEQGRVDVDLNLKGTSLVLAVQDNGRGYPSNVEAGLGTRLITTFAAQLGGTPTWNSPCQRGCRTTVEFPY
jgi:two-component system, sensor histidine kinase PdtaS